MSEGLTRSSPHSPRSDPTPEEEQGSGADEGRLLRYCSACGSDLDAETYERLTADPPAIRERIRRIRADRRGADATP